MKLKGRFEFVTNAMEREEGGVGLRELPGLQSLWKAWGSREGRSSLWGPSWHLEEQAGGEACPLPSDPQSPPQHRAEHARRPGDTSTFERWLLPTSSHLRVSNAFCPLIKSVPRKGLMTIIYHLDQVVASRSQDVFHLKSMPNSADLC